MNEARGRGNTCEQGILDNSTEAPGSGADVGTGPHAPEDFDQRWRSLTIANDFVFCKAMLDRELCREVVQTALGRPIERIEYAARQEVLDAAPDAKSVRLDVYVRDGGGTAYDVEMQAANTHELARRARYYHAMMAIDQIDRGQPYAELGDAYAIFLCNFDPFGRGRRVYSFENRCREADDLALGDGARTVFLAATAPRGTDDPPELGELLDYMASGKVSGALSARLRNRVEHVIRDRDWRREYMLLEMRDQLNAKKAREEGAALMGALVARLLADGRVEDARRAATDAAYRDRLCRELGLTRP